MGKKLTRDENGNTILDPRYLAARDFANCGQGQYVQQIVRGV